MTDTPGIKTLERHGGNALRPGTSRTRGRRMGCEKYGAPRPPVPCSVEQESGHGSSSNTALRGCFPQITGGRGEELPRQRRGTCAAPHDPPLILSCSCLQLPTNYRQSGLHGPHSVCPGPRTEGVAGLQRTERPAEDGDLTPQPIPAFCIECLTWNWENSGLRVKDKQGHRLSGD